MTEVFINIESRLGNLETVTSRLESRVGEILERADANSATTMDKLSDIQSQLETHAASMRKLKRSMTGRYTTRMLFVIILVILIVWSLFLKQVVI